MLKKLAISTLNNASTTLEQTWINEGKPEKDWETWAKKESAKDIATEENRLKQLDGAIAKWNSIKEAEVKYKTDIVENVKAKSAKEAAEEEMKKAQEGNENTDKDLPFFIGVCTSIYINKKAR